MTATFKIFKVDVDEAEKINASTNEPHQHEFEELLICVEGGLEHFIDFKTTIYNAPVISFVTKGKVHRVKPLVKDGSCLLWAIRFKSEFIAETTFQLYANFHESANIVLRADVCFRRIVALCEMMRGEMQQPEPDYAVLRQLLSTVFTMIDSERRKQQSDEKLEAGTQSVTFRNFLQILEENFRRDMGVDFYAEKLFMTARNLNTITQNILQQSVSEIIETRKLLEAKNLLTTTDKTVSEIGYELGYNEKTYFSNVFKKKSGQTPTEFRNEMRRLIKA